MHSPTDHRRQTPMGATAEISIEGGSPLGDHPHGRPATLHMTPPAAKHVQICEPSRSLSTESAVTSGDGANGSSQPSSSKNQRRRCLKTTVSCAKWSLLMTNMVLVMVSVGIVVFCIIRFVLPISFDKSGENFMIFMIPSSLTCASISAAGLLATLSGLSWPLVCYALVIMIPLASSVAWIAVRHEELQSLDYKALPMFILMIVCCTTWCVQIAASIVLATHLRRRWVAERRQAEAKFGPNHLVDATFDASDYLFIVD